MKELKLNLAIVFLSAFFTINTSCQQSSPPIGRDWVKWNGPFANGTTDEKNWDPKVLSDSSSILWKTNVGKGHSMVAIKGTYAYTFGNKKVIENGGTSFYDVISCLNSENAKEIWSYKYKSDAGNQFPGSCSSPVIEDKYLYTFGKNGDFHCLDAKSGKVYWKHQVKEMGYQAPGFGFSCSPVVYEDIVMLKVGGTGLAFNKETGEKVWTGDTTKYNSYSSGVTCNISGNENIVLLNGDSLHVVKPKTGEKLSSYPWKDVGSDPLMIKNTVFLSNMNGGSTLLDLSQNPPVEIWKNDSAKGLFQGFVKFGKHVYGFASKKNKMPLRCISLETGKIEWEEDLGKWGSLIIADNKLVIITGNGRLVIADASPKKYNEVSALQVFNFAEEDFKKNINCCWTKPVLSHGKIYARSTLGDLACVDLRF